VAIRLNFDNSYHDQLPGLYTSVLPQPLANPRLVGFNAAAARLLDWHPPYPDETALAAICCGQQLLEGMQPLAQVYAGHQFGGYTPRLGDGRGLLLGEVRNRRGEKWDIHLKGAGLTPYSRQGDGRAVLRSCIREYLASEALHHLGIPTARGLAVVVGDDAVMRESVEPGAMLIRLAESHIRFGHFEYCFFSQPEQLGPLLEYTLYHHFPDFRDLRDGAEQMFAEVVRRSAELIAKWQAYGFCHGVMNTDNMSILGITLDYGPYAFLDDYEPGHICNHSDYAGRYAFDQQPGIGLWNLQRLAHSLSGHIPAERLRIHLEQYETWLLAEFSRLMRARFGLQGCRPEDGDLIRDLLGQMAVERQDYHRVFRALCFLGQEDGRRPAMRDLFVDRERFDRWSGRYRRRLELQVWRDAERSRRMRRVNPCYVLRNYLAQQVIEAAAAGDVVPLERLLAALRQPFNERQGWADLAAAPPEHGKHLAISCSS